VGGGYVRKTLSLPSDLVAEIDHHLVDSPGLTMSSFMTTAGEDLLKKIKKRKGKKR
jgi:hypothetical protein